MLELAQPQLQKWARCSKAVFPLMFTFREKLSQVLLFPRITWSHPLSQELHLHLVLPLYIINSLEVEGAGVSPSECPVYLAPALCMFGLLSVVFSASPIVPSQGF
jgi:hypothetical protein